MGHLLTAAGMTGMLKVILAMQKKFIPATIKIDAVHSNDQKVGKDQLMLENKEWPLKGEQPHAGINAFGFGGTNAHMILSAYDENEEVAETIKSPKQSLSIAGMDLHFGAVLIWKILPITISRSTILQEPTSKPLERNGRIGDFEERLGS